LGIDTPAIYYVDPIYNRIFMEYIDGCTVKAYLKNEDIQANGILKTTG
jgi:tRNA A-37 threonylcarbamoyl transferase component Bud32